MVKLCAGEKKDLLKGKQKAIQECTRLRWAGRAFPLREWSGHKALEGEGGCRTWGRGMHGARGTGKGKNSCAMQGIPLLPPLRTKFRTSQARLYSTQRCLRTGGGWWVSYHMTKHLRKVQVAVCARWDRPFPGNHLAQQIWSKALIILDNFTKLDLKTWAPSRDVELSVWRRWADPQGEQASRDIRRGHINHSGNLQLL